MDPIIVKGIVEFAVTLAETTNKWIDGKTKQILAKQQTEQKNKRLFKVQIIIYKRHQVKQLMQLNLSLKMEWS